MSDEETRTVEVGDVEMAVENEAMIPVLIPGSLETQEGIMNGFKVVVAHCVVMDPNTQQSYVIALVFSHEEAFEWARQLKAVGSAVSPIKKQMERLAAKEGEK